MAKAAKKKTAKKTTKKTAKKTTNKPPKAELALAAAEEMVSKSEAFDAIVVKRKEIGKLSVKKEWCKLAFKAARDQYKKAVDELLGMVDDSEMPLFDQAKDSAAGEGQKDTDSAENQGKENGAPGEKGKAKGSVDPKDGKGGKEEGAGEASAQGAGEDKGKDGKGGKEEGSGEASAQGAGEDKGKDGKGGKEEGSVDPKDGKGGSAAAAKAKKKKAKRQRSPKDLQDEK